MIDVSTLLKGFGGLVGLWVLIATAWHNLKIREYERRQAVALEKLAEAKQ